MNACKNYLEIANLESFYYYIILKQYVLCTNVKRS